VPHGAIRVGGAEVVALCDAVADYGNSITDPFPTVPAEAWAPYRERYPDAFAPSGTLRLHVHCHLVRAGGRTILVDTGLGPSSAPGARFFGVAGSLLAELASVGVGPGEVDVVVLTHHHFDHIGGTADEDGAPAFPNARHLIGWADWEVLSRDPAHAEKWERSGRPIADLVERTDGERGPAAGVTVVPAPGHTPGHQVVIVDGEPSLLLSADLAITAAQLQEPEWCSEGDADPAAASAARRAWFGRAAAEGLTVATPHFSEPFGRVGAEDGAQAWLPLE